MTCSYHPFGYEGKPRTCYWCGMPLRRFRYSRGQGLGRYGRGFFHSDSCAVAWAHLMAEKGGKLLARATTAAVLLCAGACTLITDATSYRTREALDDAGQLDAEAGAVDAGELDAGKGHDGPVQVLDAGELDAGQLDELDAGDLDAGELAEAGAVDAGDGDELDCDGTPPYRPSHTYKRGELATHGAQLYECAGPVPGWCSLPGYEPGEGLYWAQAWLLLGPCRVQ